MNITVTGGAGYLGSVLVRKLLASGHKVRVIDNLIYGQASLAELEKKRNFELIRADIRDLSKLTEAITGADVVIHLAAIVGDQASEIDSRTTVVINQLTTQNIVELCKLYGVKKLIFASTCTVYGVRPGEILTENSPAAPFSLYGKTKHESEKLILGAKGKLEPVVMRIGTLFGISYRMRFDLAINLFIANAIFDKRITVFGGSQFRPFIHVSDAAEAFAQAATKKVSGVYNLGSYNVSIRELADRITAKIPAQIVVEGDIKDPRNYQVSWKKLQTALKFKPQKTIEDAATEIKRAFSRHQFADYPNPKYGNYSHILDSEEVRKKVYTQGPIFDKSNLKNQRSK